MASFSDAQLVAAARDGGRDAFAELVDRHYPLLLACCRRALGAPAAADAAQEAVLQALLGLHKLRCDERFGAWLVGNRPERLAPPACGWVKDQPAAN